MFATRSERTRECNRRSKEVMIKKRLLIPKSKKVTKVVTLGVLKYVKNYAVRAAGSVKNHFMTLWTGLLIIRGKKSEISRDLKRQIRGENGRFRGIFAGIFGPNFR